MIMLVAFYFCFAVIRDPNSSLSFWVSIAPFLAPITMPVRILAETPPFWQIGLSIVVNASCHRRTRLGRGESLPGRNVDVRKAGDDTGGLEMDPAGVIFSKGVQANQIPTFIRHREYAMKKHAAGIVFFALIISLFAVGYAVVSLYPMPDIKAVEHPVLEDRETGFAKLRRYRQYSNRASYS